MGIFWTDRCKETKIDENASYITIIFKCGKTLNLKTNRCLSPEQIEETKSDFLLFKRCHLLKNASIDMNEVKYLEIQ